MCGLSTSLPMLIFFRLIQGLAGGGLQPTQQAIIMDSFPPEKRGAVFGLTGVTLIVAPILGPTLGGLITDNFSWRWIFYINIPVGILAFTLVGQMVRDPATRLRRGSRISTISVSALSPWVSAPCRSFWTKDSRKTGSTVIHLLLCLCQCRVPEQRRLLAAAP